MKKKPSSLRSLEKIEVDALKILQDAKISFFKIYSLSENAVLNTSQCDARNSGLLHKLEYLD